MKRMDYVDVSVRAVFHPMLVVSLFLLVVGHNQPGGGFVGGLVAGASIAMRYMAGGIDAVRSLTPVKPWTILGAGIVTAGLTATIPVVFGHPPLEAHILDLHLPVFGDVHISSTLAFDSGVYLVVVGLVLMVFEAFGDDLTDRPPMEPRAHMSILLAAAAATLFGIGTYLLLQRKLSRIIIGLGLLSHGGNVLLMTSGRGGLPPLIGAGDDADLADPLPHAMALTAIVITFGVTALLLALAYRSWQLTRDDEVENDVADTFVARGGFIGRDVSDEVSAAEEAEDEAALADATAGEVDA